MAATKQDIYNWLLQADRQGDDFLIVVCDTFDYTDYPVFVKARDFVLTYNQYKHAEMQRIMEVYDLSMDIEVQMAEHRAMHLPTGKPPFDWDKKIRGASKVSEALELADSFDDACRNGEEIPAWALALRALAWRVRMQESIREHDRFVTYCDPMSLAAVITTRLKEYQMLEEMGEYIKGWQRLEDDCGGILVDPSNPNFAYKLSNEGSPLNRTKPKQ